MLIPDSNRKQVYEYLFKEGVMVASSKVHGVKHPHLTVPNLQVIKLMTSLKSRDFVRESFSWRHYYWFLTNEGIQHLRDYLHLPAKSSPSRCAEEPAPWPPVPALEGASEVEEGSSRGTAVAESRQYRKAGTDFSQGFGDKMADAGPGHRDAFRFRGGFGRGRGEGGSEDRPRRGYDRPSEDRPRGGFRASSPQGRPRDSDHGATAPQYGSSGSYRPETNGFYHATSSPHTAQREPHGAGQHEQRGQGAAPSKSEGGAPLQQHDQQSEELWD